MKAAKEPIIVYRLEHMETGKGPFHHQHRAVDAIAYVNDPGEFRNAPKFKDMTYLTSHHFGWQKPMHLLEFIRSPRILEERGFILVKLEVENEDTILYPDGQVAFFLNNVTSKEVIEWDNFYRKLFTL